MRDPSGWLRPGAIARIPFDIADSDYAFDTIALNRAPRYVLTALEAPDGTTIRPQDLPAEAHRIGHNLNGFRVNLPVVKDSTGHWAGRWHLLMTLGIVVPKTAAAARLHDDVGLPNSAILRYEAIIHARSNLRMRVRAEQDDTKPGTPIRLLARLTEYGQPFRGSATVSAVVTDPDGNTGTLNMMHEGDGRFSALRIPVQSGAHRFRLIAKGLSARGSAFTREHLVTALVGRRRDGPTGGGGPGDSSSGDDDWTDIFCRLIACFGENGVFDERFYKRLEAMGIDWKAALPCLKKYCGRRSLGKRVN